MMRSLSSVVNFDWRWNNSFSMDAARGRSDNSEITANLHRSSFIPTGARRPAIHFAGARIFEAGTDCVYICTQSVCVRVRVS